jgi:uncharacterized protein
MIENLTTEQLEGIMEALPVEFVFVDEKDIIKYWSHHAKRIMPIPDSALDKPIMEHHPEHAKAKVSQIIDDFRSGKKNKAKFWQEYKGHMYLSCYFAIRNKEGKYLGIIETVQDITKIKQIEGEKRFPDFIEDEKRFPDY